MLSQGSRKLHIERVAIINFVMKKIFFVLILLSSTTLFGQSTNGKWAYAYTQGFNNCYGSEIFSNVIDIYTLPFYFSKTKKPYGTNELYTFLRKYFQDGFEKKYSNCTALSEIIVVCDCSSFLSSEDYTKRKIMTGLACWLTKEEASKNRAKNIQEETGKILHVDF